MVNKALHEQILTDGSYYEELIVSIENAKQSIDVEMYILAFDAAGKKIIRALCKAASRGVKIRVVVDGAGTSPWCQKIKDYLESRNIIVKIYHPYPWLFSQYAASFPQNKNFFSKFLYHVSNINKRNHRKIVLIDNKVLFLGSANIHNSYTYRNSKKIPIRDTSVKISNINANEVKYAFEKVWRRIPKLSFRRHSNIFYLRYNYSWYRRRRLFNDLLKKISHAKKRVWITNAYFIGNNKILAKLKAAQARGVDVKIVLPRYYEEPFFRFLTRSFYNSLLEANLKIYEYQIGILHSKYLIIDDWYCLGSSNLNNRSLIHDLEVDVALQKSASQQMLKKIFITDLHNSKQILASDVQKTSLLAKTIGKILLLIKYWF